MTYSFICDSCGHEFDQQLLMEERNSPLVDVCPNCGTEGTVRRNLMEENAFFTMNGERMMSTKRNKPDGEFRNLLGKIKKDTGGSGNIDRFAT